MTFSIVGHCAITNMFGVAITTSSICVGARCPHARAGVGAVATQNITDPSLGPAILDVMQSGADAGSALDEIIRNRTHLDYRQLIVVDAEGRTASFTGTNILGVYAESSGEHCYAAGNLLANAAVPEAMTAVFAADARLPLARRLLNALQAGLSAGGEEGDVHSAALLVVDTQPFPLVDLRVDWDDAEPVARLETLWERYAPQMNDYLIRAIDPARAPSYGVPGDQ